LAKNKSVVSKIVLSFETKIKVSSKVVPGIVYTLYNVTEALRRTISLELADQFETLTEIARTTTKLAAEEEQRVSEAKSQLAQDRQCLAEEIPDEDVSEDLATLMEVNELNQRAAALVDNHINPVYVERVVVNVAGLEIDGSSEDIDGKRLLKDGPRELYDEALQFSRNQFGLDAEEARD